ncbi:MAG: SpoIVB peptidase [Lachnospiraceae bacterium]|nr:SpoIVB peptidase [Lachnospiraceae bacterium]
MLLRRMQKMFIRVWGLGCLGVILFAYLTLIYAIPDSVYISDKNDTLKLPLPVSFIEVEAQNDTKATAQNLGTDIQAEELQTASTSVAYECRLFGVVPIKKVTARLTQSKSLLAGGVPVGIYVKTDGVLVIGTGKITRMQGETDSPVEHLLKTGDYIEQVNGQAVRNKAQLIEAVDQSEGKKLILKIQRDGELMELAVTPVENENGDYKLGVWVRDDLAGIGTLTYVNAKKQYGALGHAVSDADTGNLLSIRDGRLYESSIIGIVKGENGTPGELTGVIDYGKRKYLGDIRQNTTAGIYGTLTQLPAGIDSKNRFPVGYKQEIRIGEASILCSVDNQTPQQYAIQITEVDFHEDEEYREIMFEVTDPALLAKTDGIVQGMSGSPILQDGKIIGAVTHVFVQNSKKGYGIFIEHMIEHN